MSIRIVAEIGNNWVRDDLTCGKKEDALEAIQCAADVGVDVVKFQVGLGRLYSKQRAPGIYSNIQRYNLPISWLEDMHEYAQSIPIDLWASIFAVDLVRHAVPYLDGIKIASGDLTYQPMIEECARWAKHRMIPLCVSTGAATNEEIKKTKDWLEPFDLSRLIFMHCVSEYPAEETNLNLLSGIQMLDMLGPVNEVGFSDHTVLHLPAQVAVGIGYTTIEKHFMPWANKSSPDACCSLDFHNFGAFVVGIRIAEQICGSYERKVSPKEESERLWARRGSDGLRPTDGVRE